MMSEKCFICSVRGHKKNGNVVNYNDFFVLRKKNNSIILIKKGELSIVHLQSVFVI